MVEGKATNVLMAWGRSCLAVAAFLAGVSAATALGGDDFLPIEVKCPFGTAGDFVMVSRNIFGQQTRQILRFRDGKIVGAILQGANTETSGIFQDVFNFNLDQPHDLSVQSNVRSIVAVLMREVGAQGASRSIAADTKKLLSVACAKTESGKKAFATKLKANELHLRKHSRSQW